MVLNTDILSFFVTFAVSLNVDIIENSSNFINIQSKMTIDQFNFAGKKAIVRVDFNVPLDENGNVTDDTRIRGALPTLKKILADGGAVIMMSHMGKPKGKVNPKLSLSQIVAKVSERLGVEVKFANDCANASEATAALKPGEALLLENLRFYPEEEGKPVGVEKGTPEYDEAKKAMKESQKEFEDRFPLLRRPLRMMPTVRRATSGIAPTERRRVLHAAVRVRLAQTGTSKSESKKEVQKMTNVKVHIKLEPVVLPDGMRSLLQASDSTIQILDEDDKND